MKYPFLFLFVSVLMATFILVVLGAAVLTETKELVVRKSGLTDISTD
jgi:hypothetical protein